MTRMQSLNLLARTELPDVSMDVLAGMEHLQVANLYRTGITNSGLARLQGLKELTDIDLRYSRVTSNGIELLRAALPNLKVQFVGSVSVRPKAAGAAPTGEQHRSRDLRLGKSDGRRYGPSPENACGRSTSPRLRSAMPESYPTYPVWLVSKTSIFTSRSRRSGACLAGASDKSSRKLDLSQTTVSDAGLEKLAGLKQLKILRLAGTLVEGKGMGRLTGLTGLRELGPLRRPRRRRSLVVRRQDDGNRDPSIELHRHNRQWLQAACWPHQARGPGLDQHGRRRCPASRRVRHSPTCGSFT